MGLGVALSKRSSSGDGARQRGTEDGRNEEEGATGMAAGELGIHGGIHGEVALSRGARAAGGERRREAMATRGRRKGEVEAHRRGRRRSRRGPPLAARGRRGRGDRPMGVCVVANKKKEAALAGNREGEMHGLGLQGGVAGPWPWAGAGGWEAQAAGLLLFSRKKNREQLKRIKRKAKNKNKMVGHICKAL